MLLTQSVYKDLQKKSDPNQEFMDPSYAHKNEIFKGIYAGTVRKQGILYDHYQFGHLLAEPGKTGPRRILEVLIPRKDDAKAEIVESAAPAAGDLPAFWFTRHIGKDRYATSETPSAYFMTYYPQIRPAAYRNHAVNVDLTPGFLDNDTPFSGDYGYVVYRLAQTPETDEMVWQPFETQVSIRWVVRNRTRFELNRLRFIYAVPFDLVTLPVQMVIVPFLK